MTLEVVGLGPVPVLAAAFDRGAAITMGALRSLMGDKAPTGADVVLLDRRAGADTAALARRLEVAGIVVDDAPIGNTVLESVGIDTTRAESTPDLLALLMLVMTTALLAYVVTTAMRERRHDLAVLRALGFTRSATRATVAVGALSVVATTLLVGVPVGIIAGKAAWHAYARELGVLDESFVAPLELAGLILGACITALLVAMAAARATLRRGVSDVLRTE
jgi:hypothetical protein